MSCNVASKKSTCKTKHLLKQRFSSNFTRCHCKHSHKNRKDCLEGSLDRVSFVAKLKFRRIVVPRLLQNSSNVNIYLTYMSYIYLNKNISSLYYSDINLFLIDYAYCKLCNIWLILFENSSRNHHHTGASH